MANRTLEMLLNKVEVKETGARRRSGQHMVIATLVWPRPRIAERVAAKTLEFEENVLELHRAPFRLRGSENVVHWEKGDCCRVGVYHGALLRVKTGAVIRCAERRTIRSRSRRG